MVKIHEEWSISDYLKFSNGIYEFRRLIVGYKLFYFFEVALAFYHILYFACKMHTFLNLP